MVGRAPIMLPTLIRMNISMTGTIIKISRKNRMTVV
jgi:hypothetical protein